jgi:hypothetical protein
MAKLKNGTKAQVEPKRAEDVAVVPELPDAEDDLEQQHSYVQQQKQRDKAFDLVAPEAFIQSIRDLGYKSTLTALDELVDNSVQARSQVVEVFLAYKPENKTQRKPDYIVIADDGHGMEPDMIRLAVKWGGTHRLNNRKGFGRYGFGLPSACVSIGEKYTVYSKVTDGDWWAVPVDIREVKQRVEEGQPLVAQAQRLDPPKFVKDHFDITGLDSGTIVVIEELDRLGTGFKTTASFTQKMLEHIGVVYRKMIPAVGFKVDGTTVQPVDPLFLDESARWYEETEVRAKAVDPIEFEVEGKDGEKGKVTIRAASFPYNFHLKDPQGPVNSANHNDRFRIMKANNGIIVCRAGRQIEVVTSLPWMTFINFDRFWAVEINFDPVLDEHFGVTTHKQQIVFTESLAERLKNHGLKDLIKDLRHAMKDSRAKVLAALGNRENKPRPSEEALAKTQPRKPRAKPSPRQAKKADENLDREARKQAEATGEPPEKVKERLEQQTRERPYKVDHEATPDGPVFRGERLSRQYRLILNTTHRFYTDIYEPAKKVPGLCSKLEAAVFILAEAELDAASDEQEAFFKAVRVHGSQRLTDVLAELDGVSEREDEASAEMEEDEASAETEGQS